MISSLNRTKMLLMATLMVCLISNSFAQFPGMGAVRNAQSMQFANQQMNFMMMNMNDRGRIENRTYGYEVIFKDGTKKTFRSKIYTDTVLHKNYLILVDTKFPKSDSVHRNQKIYAHQTLSISHHNIANDTVKGISKDTCWMFKAITGIITAYSFLSETGNNLDINSLVGLQLNNGDVVSFTEEHLKAMVSDDAAVLEDVSKKRYINAIKRYNRRHNTQ